MDATLTPGLLTYRASAEHGDRPVIISQVTEQLKNTALKSLSHGIIFAISGLPNQDAPPTPDNPLGKQAIGGMGESYVAEQLATILLGKDTTPAEFGKANRKYFEKNIYNQNPQYTGKDIEGLYESWRKNSYSAELDKELDVLVRNMAIESAEKRGFAVASSKIFSLLYMATRKDHPELAMPALITIGIDASDDVILKRATYRRVQKQYPDYAAFTKALEHMSEDEQLQLLLETIDTRRGRFEAERANWAQAYPDAVGNYSRQTMLEATDFVFKNDPDFRVPEHLKKALYHLLAEVVINVPQLSDQLLSHLPYRVTETMRVRELRSLMLEEPTEKRLQQANIAWEEKDLVWEHMEAEPSELPHLRDTSTKPVSAFTKDELTAYPLAKSSDRSYQLRSLLANGWVENNFSSAEDRVKAEKFMEEMILTAQV